MASRLFPSSRFAVTFMCFFLLFELYIMRINISMAIVCMVKSPGPPSLPINNCTTLDGAMDNCTGAATGAYQDGGRERLVLANGSEPAWTNDTTTLKGEFEWSKRLQGFILGSYFFGYILTQAVGGWLAGRYGGKHVAGTGLLISVIATVLLPSAARLSPYLAIVLRVAVGAASGVLFPSVQSLLGIWAPPLERTTLSSFTFYGMTVGIIAALLVSSQFCALPVDNGWPFAFYVTGGSGFLCWICWNFIMYNSPAVHPRISQRELDYISKCTGVNKNDRKQRPPFPWKKALTSPPVLAIVIAQTSSTWLLYTNLAVFPTYMKEVLKFDIRQNGLVLILPQICIIITSLPAGQLTDFLRRRRLLSTAAIRKLFQSASCFGSAAFVVGLSFMDHKTRYVAVVINIIMTTLQNVCNRCGYLVNPQDVAPSYSGEVFGIVNTSACLSGILAPIVCGLLTPTGTPQEWKMVFYIAAAFVTFGGIVFVIFAKGEVLPWAKVGEDVATTKFKEADSGQNGLDRHDGNETVSLSKL